MTTSALGTRARSTQLGLLTYVCIATGQYTSHRVGLTEGPGFAQVVQGFEFGYLRSSFQFPVTRRQALQPRLVGGGRGGEDAGLRVRPRTSRVSSLQWRLASGDSRTLEVAILRCRDVSTFCEDQVTVLP